ncbi:MAG: AAA family ATPase [Chitinophagaceae bacterium]|nr:AAA family ATPase [Oligoflexus sp.]
MSKQKKVIIRKLATGVQGLDEVCGGGLPEYSFNIIGGSPGCGKTTLAHQIMFANATPEKPALFFTILGEPAFKMLRYQQQYDFFDHEKLKSCIRFINLSKLALEGDLDAVLNEIVKEVAATSPGLVIVDSFRTMNWNAQSGNSSGELQAFVQKLALYLASWQATTFLIAEYSDSEIQNHPIFTVADGLFWLYQKVERNSIVRKMQIMKLRGQASIPGIHTIRLNESGMQIFPRTFGLTNTESHNPAPNRISLGIPELDALMGGGVHEGNSLIVSGPSGAGKSILGAYFIAEGLRVGEAGVIAVFEETPDSYLRHVSQIGIDLAGPRKDGRLQIIYLRPLDLSVDETLHEVAEAVKRVGAKRIVIDSLAGFEMALAPGFRFDFRESLYRMIRSLTKLGVTVLSTVETQEKFDSFGLSNYNISFLSDSIIRLRYVSIRGRLRKLLAIVKMRGSEHSSEMYEYSISASGIKIEKPFKNYRGLISGIPSPWDPTRGPDEEK